MRTSGGREFLFLGADPVDPEVCVWSVQGVAGISRQIFGLANAASEHAALLRRNLRPLFPLTVGASTEFVIQTSSGGWRYRWRVTESRNITVPAGTFDVWVLEALEEGQYGNIFRGRRTFYIDKFTNLVVRYDVETMQGWPGYGAPWVALRIENRGVAR
jgi:hypothetical protein